MSHNKYFTKYRNFYSFGSFISTKQVTFHLINSIEQKILKDLTLRKIVFALKEFLNIAPMLYCQRTLCQKPISLFQAFQQVMLGIIVFSESAHKMRAPGFQVIIIFH